jgi:flagellar biosynthesis/type III secretory pathway protein FliH
MDRLKVLNDFAFQKAFGEKGDEPQLLAFLNATLERTGKGNLESVEILENKDLPADIVGGKSGKLDMIARDPDLLRSYEQYEKAASDWTTGINGARREGRLEGERKGRLEGERKGRLETARNLKALGILTAEQIRASTGVSLDDIAKL